MCVARAGIHARDCGRSALRESSKYTRIGHHIPRAGTSARPTIWVMCISCDLGDVCGEGGHSCPRLRLSSLRESSKYTRIGHHIPRAGTSARPTVWVMCMSCDLCDVCGEGGHLCPRLRLSGLRESSKYTRIGHHIPRAGTSARPTIWVMCISCDLCDVCGEVGRAFMPAIANPPNSHGTAAKHAIARLCHAWLFIAMLLLQPQSGVVTV